MESVKETTIEVTKEVEKQVTNLYFYAIKTSDIIYVTVLYFVFGYYIAKIVNTICDTIFGTDFNDLTTFELSFEIFFQICLTYIFTIYGKRIIEKIPFPLEGKYGFIHLKLKELVFSGGISWCIGILFYERSVVKKILILKNKIKF